MQELIRFSHQEIANILSKHVIQGTGNQVYPEMFFDTSIGPDGRQQLSISFVKVPYQARVPDEYHPPTRGFVYIIKSDDGLYKIGQTTDVKGRVNGLKSGNPHKLTVVHSIETDLEGSVLLEKHLHARY